MLPLHVLVGIGDQTRCGLHFITLRVAGSQYLYLLKLRDSEDKYFLASKTQVARTSLATFSKVIDREPEICFFVCMPSQVFVKVSMSPSCNVLMLKLFSIAGIALEKQTGK